MAGRHRRPPAWRRLLTSLVRSRDRARAAALQAEVVALRATVAHLRDELGRVQALAAAPVVAAAGPADVRWVTLQMPLVQLAFGDPDEVAGPDVAAALAAPDRSPDSAETEIVLAPPPAPVDRPAWSVLANLPERPLLDPRSDRDGEPRDPAAGTTAAPAAAGHPHRRTA